MTIVITLRSLLRHGDGNGRRIYQMTPRPAELLQIYHNCNQESVHAILSVSLKSVCWL